MGYEVKECKWCRKPYQYSSYRTGYCADCDTLFDKAFVMIRDYLDENPGANIQEVHENTEVDEKLILQLLKDERLSFTGGNYLTCDQCGAGIPCGRFCSACEASMKKNLSQMLSGYQKSDKDIAQSMSTPDFHNKVKK